MLNDDVMDEKTAADKKDFLLERLNKRNKERLNYIDVKLEERNKEQSEAEGADYFAQTFGMRAREIEARLQIIRDTTAKRTVGDALNPIELARQFADITVDIQSLQNYLTTSTIFITEFKVGSSQKVLNDLRTKSEEMRLKLMPKKKFGFSNRKASSKIDAGPPQKVTKAADKTDAPSKFMSDSLLIWTLSKRHNEYICLRADEVNGKDITISSLDNCFVEIQGHAGSVQINKATNCTFLCGPIARSLFAEFCQDCTLAMACQQMRLHSSSSIRIFLHVTCRAIIEDCKGIEVSDYNYVYPMVDSDFQKAGLDNTQNNYEDVADFNWLSPDVPSPNWTLVKHFSNYDWDKLREKFIEDIKDNTDL